MQHIIKDTWLFPVIQSIHLVGLTVLVGTVALVDFSRLGLGIRRIPASEVARRLTPWTTAGLITVFATGPLMFWSDWTRYVKNPAFLVKMALLVAAFAIHRTTAPNGKRAAVLSLVIWSCVVLAGRAIADFDIVQ